MTNNYRVFNRFIQINCDSSRAISEGIQYVLGLYGVVSEFVSPEVIINIGDEIEFNTICNNPSIHGELRNGFVINNSLSGKISFQKNNEDVLVINMRPNQKYFNDNLVFRFFDNGEFSSVEDRLSSVLFESIFVPMTFFFDDLALIHSASFIGNNDAISIGGTGGIGKTSLEIEMCFNNNYKFINDDIAVIDKEGNIYPNYARPKIYGYNLENNNNLEAEIFKNRSLCDKLSWKYKAAKNGIHKVRRKVLPQLFNAVSIDNVKLGHYFMLSRYDKLDIEINDLDLGDVVVQTHNIIKTEYQHFFKHILWHNYNCKMLNKKPIVEIDTVDYKSTKVLASGCKDVVLKSILVPQNIKHSDYLSSMGAIVRSLEN